MGADLGVQPPTPVTRERVGQGHVPDQGQAAKYGEAASAGDQEIAAPTLPTVPLRWWGRAIGSLSSHCKTSQQGHIANGVDHIMGVFAPSLASTVVLLAAVEALVMPVHVRVKPELS
jgi:hypothetical protein